MLHDDREFAHHEEDRVPMRDVHKALLSVSALADQGYDCVLSKVGGELRDTVTGDTIPLHRRDNLYFMAAWVKQDLDVTRPVHRKIRTP